MSKDRNAILWQNLKKKRTMNKVDHPFLSVVFPQKGKFRHIKQFILRIAQAIENSPG